MVLMLKDESEFLNGLSDRTRIFIPDNIFYASCNKTIAIAGAGGIGGLVIELLARWGIKKFRIADMDKFEISNLNRQVLATVNNIGEWKAEVAEKRIKAINPYARVELIINDKLEKKNISQFVEGADIIINAVDSHSCYILLDNAARKQKIPLIFGHGFGPWSIKIYIFDYRRASQRGLENPFKFKILNQIRNRYAKATLNDIERMNEAELDAVDYHPTFGSMGFTVNLCACYMVAETIKLLTGIGKVNLYPKEIVLDILNSKMEVHNKYSFLYIIKQLRELKKR